MTGMDKKNGPAHGLNRCGDRHYVAENVPVRPGKFKAGQWEAHFILESLRGDPCGLPMARAVRRLAESLGVSEE